MFGDNWQKSFDWKLAPLIFGNKEICLAQVITYNRFKLI